MEVLNDEQAKKLIGENVRRYRGDRSLRWLARAVESHPINISRIEDGESMPGAGILSRIAEALGVSINALYEPASKKSRHSA